MSANVPNSARHPAYFTGWFGREGICWRDGCLCTGLQGVHAMALFTASIAHHSASQTLSST
eukprot:4849376-Amphidinium_carterae.1